ncbi:MAG: SMI1/KNR4 family protein [Planctomycetota bacterium]
MNVYKFLKLKPLIFDANTKLNQRDLKHFSVENNFTFPREYVEFLKSVNGGSPLASHVDLEYKIRKKRYTVSNFYPFLLGRKWVAQPHVWSTSNDFRPLFLFEIASNNRDIYLLVSLHSMSFGQIYHYDPQVSRMTSKSTHSQFQSDIGIKLVANSFTEFLGNISVKPWSN